MKFTLFRFLKENANRKGPLIIVVSIIAGVANGLAVVIIGDVAQTFSDIGVRSMLMFVLCVAIFLVAKRFTLLETASIVRNALSKTHMRIAEASRHCSMISLEKIDPTKVYTTVTENTDIISEATRILANAISSVVMIIFCFFFLLVLSSTGTIFSVIAIFCGIFVVLSNHKKTNQGLRLVNAKEGEFFSTFKHLLDGFKETKMDKETSEDILYNYLERVANTSNEMRVETDSLFVSNWVFIQAFFFVLLGTMVFLLPQISEISPSTMVLITAVLLFMARPVGDVVDSIPLVARAALALEKLESLESELKASDDTINTVSVFPFERHHSIETLMAENLYFQYPMVDARKGFTVGPIDLTVEVGEVLFIVGGNGSGKTTLLKLLTGLYYPHEGFLRLNNILIDRTNYEHYRSLISVIFTDFHLFDRLYGIQKVDLNKLNELLRKMELSKKVGYLENRFTELNLSTGQRKRLALLRVLMKAKPICVFDEVAADQDPIFRKRFYEEILQDLKRQGKTIIAATHDDKYFHLADRVLKMDYGKLTII